MACTPASTSASSDRSSTNAMPGSLYENSAGALASSAPDASPAGRAAGVTVCAVPVRTSTTTSRSAPRPSGTTKCRVWLGGAGVTPGTWSCHRGDTATGSTTRCVPSAALPKDTWHGTGWTWATQGLHTRARGGAAMRRVGVPAFCTPSAGPPILPPPPPIHTHTNNGRNTGATATTSAPPTHAQCRPPPVQRPTASFTRPPSQACVHAQTRPLLGPAAQSWCPPRCTAQGRRPWCLPALAATR
jgi:hypothetical protein